MRTAALSPTQQAAYRFVDGIRNRADGRNGAAPWWYGWALREAYEAGAAEPTVASEACAKVISIIELVESRCMAADGPVTPTTKEITEDELRAIYRAAKAGAAGKSDTPATIASLTTIALAKDAVAAVLRRIRADERIAFFFDPITDSYEKLTAAHAALHGMDLEKFRAEFREAVWPSRNGRIS